MFKLQNNNIITTGDDFHNNNLVPLDYAYHRGTEILQVISKDLETGSWLCSDCSYRDSYKLFKIVPIKEVFLKFLEWYKTSEITSKCLENKVSLNDSQKEELFNIFIKEHYE